MLFFGSRIFHDFEEYQYRIYINYAENVFTYFVIINNTIDKLTYIETDRCIEQNEIVGSILQESTRFAVGASIRW